MTDDDAVVRDARQEDVPLLERVLPSGGDHARQLANAVAGRRDFLVVTSGGVPVGTVVVRWAGIGVGGRAVPEIGSLAVAPRWRGRGLATRLVAAAERRVHDRGGRAAAMAVAETNQAALRLYLGLGYGGSGRRPAPASGAGQGDVATELVLVKEL
ncbi:GNAT family N-acetyltransferase [Georgenia sp. H159]|uniref:GNAT family N-acetyltransferase n=1 Tax=Georgenia sp. H159 TaxID=3076115 RepID=UPI002D796FE9|nr:GNAT family N-acetyltransferase [Georgenia sp. H159]